MSTEILGLVLTAVSIILAQVLALWRIHFAQIRRMDGMQQGMIQRMDQTSEELRAGQQTLAKAVARLDSRLSRLEGVILPKPWEIPKESPIA